MAIKYLNDETLEEEIKNSKKLLVDFYADWCGPCKRMSPIFEEVSKNYSEIVFAKLDVDSNPLSSSKYGIRSIPSLLYFEDGNLKDTNVGSLDKSELAAKIEKLLR